MARNLACQWGKNSWSVEMRGMPVRWNSARHIVAIILQCSKTFPHCHNLSRRHCCATSWKFVNYEQTRHNYWVTWRANACRDVTFWNVHHGLARILTQPHVHCQELIGTSNWVQWLALAWYDDDNNWAVLQLTELSPGIWMFQSRQLVNGSLHAHTWPINFSWLKTMYIAILVSATHKTAAIYFYVPAIYIQSAFLPYTFLPACQCHLNQYIVTYLPLTYLVKYSTTQNIARSVCDSWASCPTTCNLLLLSQYPVLTIFTPGNSKPYFPLSHLLLLF